MATDFLSDKLGEVLNQQGLGTNVLNQKGLMSTALNSISQSNSQVDSILRSLESMPVSGLIPNDNSDYSLLTNGVAVKATHRGGARNSELTIRNTTDHPVVFQPAQFALESKRETQRLGVGGVDGINSEEEQPVKHRKPRFIKRGNIKFDIKVPLKTDLSSVMKVKSRDRYLGIEMNTIASGFDGAHLKVAALPLDKNGNAMQNAYNPKTFFKNIANYLPAGGHVISILGMQPIKDSTFDGGDNPYGTLWLIQKRPQQAVNNTSIGVDVNIEYNPLK